MYNKNVNNLHLQQERRYVIYSMKDENKTDRFRVDFYKTDAGEKPLSAFIKSLDLKTKAKVVANLSLLEEYGNMAHEPLSKYLGDGLFELRTKTEKAFVRLLYFFDEEKIIVATNGFIKKANRTPKSEIDLAKKRREDYFSRKDTENDE